MNRLHGSIFNSSTRARPTGRPRRSLTVSSRFIFPVLASILLVVGAAGPFSERGPAPARSSPSMMSSPPEPTENVQPRGMQAYGQLPLSFEANRGQTDQQVKFFARGRGYTLFLTPTDAVLTLRNDEGRMMNDELNAPHSSFSVHQSSFSSLRMKLVGANPAPLVVGQEPLPGTVNDFIGNDPQRWRTGIPTYARVAYQDVYPGIDLVYYGNQRQLEYDLIVAPGADPDRITLTFDGAERVEIDPSGDLVLHVAGGEQLRQHRPFIYQNIAGQRVEVGGAFKFLNPQSAIRNPQSEGPPQVVGFEVGAYDASRPLCIDPVLDYSTYLGGNNFDGGTGIAVGADGSAYVTGFTTSTNFPTEMPFQPTFGGETDAFVVKLDPTGSAIVYATYLGGSSDDSSNDIAVDGDGQAHVTGDTRSSNFPTQMPLQAGLGGDFDAFVTVLDPTGQLFFSTYLGGNQFDAGFGIAVDADHGVYVTGDTAARNFPIRNPFPNGATFRGGPIDAFVTKLIPPLVEAEPAEEKLAQPTPMLAYSSYLGGNEVDSAGSIVVDEANNAYVTGRTNSFNFPLVSPLQRRIGGGFDAFITKVNAAGNQLDYSTFLGGAADDYGRGITLGVANGNADAPLGVAQADGPYVTGFTASTNFPRMQPLQNRAGGGGDAFVAKLSATGMALEFSTYLGGQAEDFGFDIAVDASKNIYIVGFTQSSDFPLADALQMTNRGAIDAFVTKLTPMAAALDYSTYLGGGSADRGFSIAVDEVGNAYVTGSTNSNDFPRARALQATLQGMGDAFIAKIID